MRKRPMTPVYPSPRFFAYALTRLSSIITSGFCVSSANAMALDSPKPRKALIDLIIAVLRYLQNLFLHVPTFNHQRCKYKKIQKCMPEYGKEGVSDAKASRKC